MPKLELKVLPDEEVARRLHEELNPESSPISGIRRNRKAPTFYSPPFGGTDHPTSDDDKAPLSKPGSGRKGKQSDPKPEKAASSPGNRRSEIQRDDSAEVVTLAARRSAKRQKIEEPLSALEPRESRILRDRSSSRPLPATRTQKQEKELPVRDSASELGFSEGWARGSSTDRSMKAEPITRLTRSQLLADEANTQRGSGKSGKSEIAKKTTLITRSESFSQGSGQGNGKQDRKIPKMPMCQLGPQNLWYRARNIGENKNQVHLEFPGVVGVSHTWWAKSSPKIWSGSMKGKDWKHLGDGAWEPKVPEFRPPKKGGRGRKRSRPIGHEQSLTISSSNESSEDEEMVMRANIGAQNSMPYSNNPDQGSMGEVVNGGEEGNGNQSSIEALKQEENGVRDDEGNLKEEDSPQEDAETRKEENEDDPPKHKKRKGHRGRRVSNVKQNEDVSVANESESAPTNKGHGEKNSEPVEEKKKDSVDETEQNCNGVENGEKGENETERINQLEQIEAVEKETPSKRRNYRNQSTRQRGKGTRGRRKAVNIEENAHRDFREEGEETPAKLDKGDLEKGPEGIQGNGLANTENEPQESPSNQLQDDEETEALEALGALANPSLMGTKQDGTSSPKVQASARNRKRALAKARLDTLKENANLESFHSASLPISPKAALLAKVAEEEANSVDRPPSEAWKGGWKLKHIQRMEEVEAEEEAAEHEDLVEEFGAQNVAPLATKRPVRAIKIPKPIAVHDRDTNYSKGREIDLETVSPSPQRGGRGRGRWANHVKKGTRGGRNGVGSTPQDTPRAPRRGGRGGRGGGRWGNRQAHAKQNPTENPCLTVFGSLISALDEKRQANLKNHQNGLLPSSQPSQQILDIPAEKLAPYSGNLLNGSKDFSFRMPPPSIPLFRPTNSPLFLNFSNENRELFRS